MITHCYEAIRERLGVVIFMWLLILRVFPIIAPPAQWSDNLQPPTQSW